jgi:hypothetical protein
MEGSYVHDENRALELPVIAGVIEIGLLLALDKNEPH